LLGFTGRVKVGLFDLDLWPWEVF